MRQPKIKAKHTLKSEASYPEGNSAFSLTITREENKQATYNPHAKNIHPEVLRYPINMEPVLYKPPILTTINKVH